MNKQQNILDDIAKAQRENYETTRELIALGYLPHICAICLDPACSGEYTHYTTPTDIVGEYTENES